ICPQKDQYLPIIYANNASDRSGRITETAQQIQRLALTILPHPPGQVWHTNCFLTIGRSAQPGHASSPCAVIKQREALE
ncbi:hypothetical protein, partial [Mesorhizobium sp. M4A.F.Ca.ET.090.04.2.1]|uniref:hypothetical protein n=1 Tax=Mesorhizobium sp. M4A.F.Ca.ET.090.04.2.1 TaxID=2496663 RepID=UPI001AECD4B1